MNNKLIIYTMTQFTKDFGDEIICRAHHLVRGKSVPKEIVCRGKTLEEVRKKLADKHPGLICLPRDSNDNPVILESWI